MSNENENYLIIEHKQKGWEYFEPEINSEYDNVESALSHLESQKNYSLEAIPKDDFKSK